MRGCRDKKQTPFIVIRVRGCLSQTSDSAEAEVFISLFFELMASAFPVFSASRFEPETWTHLIFHKIFERTAVVVTSYS